MSTNSQIKQNKSFDTFLTQYPVFNLDELDHFLTTHHTGNRNTRNSLLSYYKKQGRIISIRRELYATVPKGRNYETYPVDPILIASRLVPDSVLSYHTALEFHGKAYTITKELTYTSKIKSEPLHFQGHYFRRVPVPPALQKTDNSDSGVIITNWNGLNIHVTSYERTLVDSLDRPDLTGSWEEIWRSLESIQFFDLDEIFKYVTLLGKATTIAKVGFFLEQHKENLMVEENYLIRLQQFKPKQPHYAERSNRQNCRLFKQWNLLVPKEVINRSWGEVL